MKTVVIDGREYLYADKNKVVTNGIDIYGKKVYLNIGLSGSDFYEISESEYQKMTASQESENADDI